MSHEDIAESSQEFPSLAGLKGALILESGCPLERLSGTLLARWGLEVVSLPSVEAVVAALATQRPKVLVLSLFMSRAFSDALQQALSRPEHADVRTILVTKKALEQRYVDKAKAVPRSTLVAGGSRFHHQVLEAVAVALGAKQRVHLRNEHRLAGTLREVEGGEQIPVEVENISESGVKISVDRELEPGTMWTLHLMHAEHPLTIHAEVARAYCDGDRWHLGMVFVNAQLRQLRTLRHILGLAVEANEEADADAREQAGNDNNPRFDRLAVRTAPRVMVPARLKLKARIRHAGSTEQSYLDVVDISERGFRGRPMFQGSFELGQQATVTLLWGGRSISATCEVVRKAPHESGRGVVYGFRFLSVHRAMRGRLASLIAEAASRGLRRAPTNQRAPRERLTVRAQARPHRAPAR